LTAAAEPARAPIARPGPVARAERVGTRWRDVQWVDFTSEPDSGVLPAPEPAAEPAAVPEMPPAAEPAPPAAPVSGGVQRRFPTSSATSPEATGETLPGLKSRFIRLPMPRSSPAPVRPGPIRAAPASPPGAPPPPEPPSPEIAPLARMPRTGSIVVHPRAPVVGAAAPEPKPAPEPPAPRSLAAAPPDDAVEDAVELPFPASITTPVSTAQAPGDAAPRSRRHGAFAERGIVAGLVLRRASGAVVATAARGLARARSKLPRRPAAQPGGAAEPRSAAKSATTAWLSSAIGDWSRYLATKENRLRLSGVIALTAVLIALAAYIGGALLTRMAGTNVGATSASPAGAITKQLALADKAAHPVPAAVPAPAPSPPPSNVPPTDPAARAAFYLARAKAGDAAAQYDTGVLYARGDGLVQDYASAATWFHAAAAQGNVAAEYNLGVLYERGLGVATNLTEALNWYRSAADRNHPGAQFNLAHAYADGSGGAKQDFATAARWYQRAAEQGLTPAMVNLAILYEAGSGVARSPVDAYAWYSAAGERGDSGAKQRAGELFQQFGEKDKARAEGLAATIGAALDQTTPPAGPATDPTAAPRP